MQFKRGATIKREGPRRESEGTGWGAGVSTQPGNIATTLVWFAVSMVRMVFARVQRWGTVQHGHTREEEVVENARETDRPWAPTLELWMCCCLNI